MGPVHYPVPGFETYFATQSGEIWRDNQQKGFIKLSPCVTRLGYLQLPLMLNGNWKTQKNMLVHRVIALAFMRKPHHGEEINHIDGDKSNNSVNNLQWVTRSQNIIHAYHELGATESRPRGLKQWQAKFSDEEVIKIFDMKNLGLSIPEIEIAFNGKATKSNIYHILNFHTYKHITYMYRQIYCNDSALEA
jgi:hypothetical protein